MMFTKVMKARQVEIDATILFADLRGYTGLSKSRSTGAISELLDAFYDECAEAIWEGDGIVNKTMGDAVMAVFNFPIGRDDHATQAVQAARSIQRRWIARREMLAEAVGADGGKIGVGVGNRLRKGKFRRVRARPSRSDRDRHGSEHCLARAIGGRRRRNTPDPGRLRKRGI